MTKKKTSELHGAALDWAVAQAVGVRVKIQSGICYDAELLEMEADGDTRYIPSEDWGEGGPIIERECISVEYGRGEWLELWLARKRGEHHVAARILNGRRRA